MAEIDIELRGVVKRFGAFTAVKGIDLTVSRGRFVTLLGPSGCGKTTTLRMIGGFEAPDAGSITVAGQPLRAGASVERLTRMVFQNYALFQHMTVADNIAFGLRMQKCPAEETRRRIEEIVAQLGLGTQLAKYPRQLSGGQQQRVALARALVTRPRVLLLDEPLGALDLKMRKHMQGELLKLQRDVGITFVYVTHDQEEAMHLSDTIVVMDQGEIVQQGSTAEIYLQPDTAYVADFIGEANLLSGHFVAAPAPAAASAIGVLPGTLPARHQPPTGAAVLYCIRPEFVATGAAAQGLAVNAQGTVRAVSYIGASSRLTLDIGGTALRADVPGLAAVEPGSTLRVGWRAEQGRILPHDARFAGTPVQETNA